MNRRDVLKTLAHTAASGGLVSKLGDTLSAEEGIANRKRDSELKKKDQPKKK